MTEATDAMRIGELSARVGVSAHTLRAWERRYGLLRPLRTDAGYRVYGSGDEHRVRAVVALVADRVPASQAVARVLAQERLTSDRGEPRTGGDAASELATFESRMWTAVAAFDEAAVHDGLDRVFAVAPLDDVVEMALLPFLRYVGERWGAGEATIAHEHFVSNLIRRRLAAYTHTWDQGDGPVAVLACLPGEQHDIALLCLGVLLGRAGWRVRYLGADTPVEQVAGIAAHVNPDVIVISGRNPALVAAQRKQLATLSRRHRLVLAGPSAAGGRAPGRATRHTGSVVATVRAIAADARSPR